jgi:restriction endonuclease Mrr
MKQIRYIVLIFVLLAFGLNAQQEKASSDVIETAVAKLQQKVLLTDEQSSEVKTLLTGNENKLNDPATINNVKTKVEGLLDMRQKAKYQIIKDDWWNNLSKDLQQSAK